MGVDDFAQRLDRAIAAEREGHLIEAKVIESD